MPWATTTCAPTSRRGTCSSPTSSKSEKAVASAIEAQLASDFGDSPAVLLRTVSELQRVGRSSPYAKAGANPSRHHVTFLAKRRRRPRWRPCRRCRPAGTMSWSSTGARSTCTPRTATPRRSTAAVSSSAGSAWSARRGTGTPSRSSASWPAAEPSPVSLGCECGAARGWIRLGQAQGRCARRPHPQCLGAQAAGRPGLLHPPGRGNTTERTGSGAPQAMTPEGSDNVGRNVDDAASRLTCGPWSWPISS